MRLATLNLTPELFVQFCQVCKDGPARKMVVKENALPDDAKIAGIIASVDRWPMTLKLVIESDSFADVPEGQPLPDLPLVLFETVYDECTELVA